VYTLVDSGESFTCAAKKYGGAVECWGSNTGGRATPSLSCGDGVVQAGEACDDLESPAAPGAGCSADCQSTEEPGNGILDPGEVCDDASNEQGDWCSDDGLVSSICGGVGGDVDALCDDDNECTAATCDEQVGCGSVPVADGTSCAEGA